MVNSLGAVADEPGLDRGLAVRVWSALGSALKSRYPGRLTKLFGRS